MFALTVEFKKGRWSPSPSGEDFRAKALKIHFNY